jgi:nitrate/nitrite transporter NarK
MRRRAATPPEAPTRRVRGRGTGGRSALVPLAGVEYFKRVHGLGPAAAGGFATVLGAASAVGILTGGMLADRLLRRGHVNARVYVAAFGAIGATLYLIGMISDLIAPNTALGLRWAIVTACPFYALGGLIMLGAARYYPRDIAYVIAHSRRASAAPAVEPGPTA